MVGHAKRCTTKFRLKDVEGGIFGRFFEFDKCRPEVADVWLWCVAVEPDKTPFRVLPKN